MKLYNTMSRQIEIVAPIHPGEIGLYACGLTVYDYTHIGHLRRYTMDDVLIRTLRHAGFTVKFVQNITDVGHLASDEDTGEDKLEKGAKKYGQSVWDIAHKFEDYFFRSMDLMGNLRPDVSCRATEHIPEQLAMVLELEKKGYTYVIQGDGVYFDTSKIKDYGKLARLDLAHLKEGARVQAVAGKKNPTDFALWKFERPGENRAMSWPSPWAEKSFPGWHIECSAMSTQYLGDQFDIHTGAIDHIPVHHTNEIAQAEAATDKKPFVRYWVHHNFLQAEGEKMSKSLGNFYTIDDVVEKGFTPQELRLLFLGSHYRSELNFTWDSLAGAKKAWQRLVAKIQALSKEADQQADMKGERSAKVNAFTTEFWTYMEDDLKTPEALSVLWEVLKNNQLSATEKMNLLFEFDQVLGLKLNEIQSIPESQSVSIPGTVQKLIEQRVQARSDKNWQQADELRDQLADQGFEVIDTAEGQKIKPKG